MVKCRKKVPQKKEMMKKSNMKNLTDHWTDPIAELKLIFKIDKNTHERKNKVRNIYIQNIRLYYIDVLNISVLLFLGVAKIYQFPTPPSPSKPIMSFPHYWHNHYPLIPPFA